MQLSLVEAVFCALAVGFGEVYFVADAIRLGATTLEQGLVVTLPLSLGTLGPILTLMALRRFQKRRAVVVTAVALQASVLLTIGALSYFGLQSPRLLIAMACAYQLCGQAAGTAWSSWYGDVVPALIRGRYFARRTRIVHLNTSLALLSSGFLLHWLEPGAPGAVAPGTGGNGFAVVFALAGLSRLISGILLISTPEPPFSGLPGVRSTRAFLSTEDGRPLRRLLGIAAALQLLVYVSSPYFGPYMLRELKLTYIEYMLASLSVVLLKVLSLPAWGKAIDQYGARPAYLLAALLVAIVPVPWLWATGIGWIVFAQFLSGVSWGGHELAHFSLLLEATPPYRRPHVFAAMNAANGIAQLAGSLVGAKMLESMAHGGYHVVFAVSIAGRLLVAAIAPSVIPQSAGRKHARRRQVLLRMLGIEPSGGATHRPMLSDDAERAKMDTEP